MGKDLLTNSFAATLLSGVLDCIGEYVEMGLDALTDDEVLKSIPFVSTVKGIFNFGKNIRDKAALCNLANFMDQINKGIANEDKREKYAKKFSEKKEFREKELEYLLILIERQLRIEKPRMLAKLYLAYIGEEIDWNELTMYAEVIDRFLTGDFECLAESNYYKTTYDKGTAPLQRLIAQGLIIENVREEVAKYDEENEALEFGDFEALEKKERHYQRTDFGDKLVEIICRDEE